MKSPVGLLISWAMIVCITCLVNSGDAVTLETPPSNPNPLDQSLFYHLEPLGPQPTPQLPITPDLKSRYRYSTGSQDEIHFQNSDAFPPTTVANPPSYPINLRSETRDHHTHRTFVEDNWVEEPEFILLVLVFAIVKGCIIIIVIRRSCARHQLQHPHPQRYSLSPNLSQLQEQIIYHQNETEHLKKYFLQIEKFQREQYNRRENQHQHFAGYGQPERYYSESSARTHRSQSVEAIETSEQRLEKYLFGENVGEGDRKAVNLRTGERVLVRVLERMHGERGDLYVRILKMLPLTAGLVRIVEVVEMVDKVYVVMQGEYQPLHSYLHSINPSTLSESQAISILKQLISSIETLNQLNICHSSISPHHIFINPSLLQIKITPTPHSFLLHSPTPPHPHPHPSYNHPYYSPQTIFFLLNNNNQILHEPLLCDIWACGVVFYQLIFWKLPFDPLKPSHQLFYNIQNEPLKMDRETSKGSRMLILGMLAKNPEQRFGVDEIKAWIQLTEDSLSRGGEEIDERKRRFKSRIQVWKGEYEERNVVRKNPMEVMDRVAKVLGEVGMEFRVVAKYAVEIEENGLGISLQMLEGGEPAFVVVFSEQSQLAEDLLHKFQL